MPGWRSRRDRRWGKKRAEVKRRGPNAFQTLGLVYTTASNAAFSTGLNVVLVPVCSLFAFGLRIESQVLFGVFLAASKALLQLKAALLS